MSSQIDADRLDYLVRDAYRRAGRARLRSATAARHALCTWITRGLQVYRRAIEPVEGYLLTLDQMYRTVYYHHTARVASVMLSAVLRRAFELRKNGDRTVLPTAAAADSSRCGRFWTRASRSPLKNVRLAEFGVFALIEDWQHSRDVVLADLARRLLRRHLSKAIDVDPRKYNTLQRLQNGPSGARARPPAACRPQHRRTMSPSMSRSA